MEVESILVWLQDWYQSYCNGDWEHGEGISIGTIDNPGWRVIINLEGTELEDLHIDYTLVEKSEDDWYALKAGKMRFEGYGDPSKLQFLLEKFREIIEYKEDSTID